ncbi:MAG: hypothetical protein CMD88_01425 [Gammaproteobacteria bacterium]|nr:hypothetical protein [Gammaproteobacteria bacterium]|tara:strand:+ start:199967 stop:200452 length:486 start_codon:yes stop_codon:yes gene_type:complete
MPLLDLSIIFFIIFWSILGLLRGFASEFISFTCWALAIYFSIHYHHIPAEFINNYINAYGIAKILSFIFIFVVTFFLSMSLSFIITQIINVFGMSSTNKVFGMFFGLLKGNLFTILIIYVIGYTEFISTLYWEQSQFIPYFEEFTEKFLKSHNSFFDTLQI